MRHTTDADIEQALTVWADHVAPNSPPDRLLKSTFARTMGARQQRAYPWLRVPATERRPGYSGFAARIAIAVALILAVVLGAGVIGGGSNVTPSPSPSPSPSPLRSTAGARPPLNTLTQPTLPAATSIVADATIDMTEPMAMVSDGDSLWVLAVDGRIDRIDPATNSVVDSLATLGPNTDEYQGLALHDAQLWATDFTSRLVYRVSAAPLALVTSIPVGKGPKGVLANADGVWVADVRGGSVLRIDPVTNNVGATIIVGPEGASGPSWLGQGIGSIWVDIPNNGTIVRLDPITNDVQATILTPIGYTPCGGMAFADDAAWVTSCSAGTLIARVDANSDTLVATIELGGNGYNPTLINGFIWVSVDGGGPESGKIVGINPDTNSIDRVLVPSRSFGGGGDIVVAAGSVWVVDGYHNAILRLPMTAFGA